MGHNDLELTLKNDINEISRMSDALQAWGNDVGIPEDPLREMLIVLDDLATNVINHAFPKMGEHLIDIKFHYENSSVRCVISDDGIPFNPLEVKPPDIEQPVEQRKIGGLGVAIAKALVDDIKYERMAGKNVLTLMKKF